MALRKPELQDPTAQAQTLTEAPVPIAPFPSAERTEREHARTTAVSDSDAMIWAFNLRMMRSGAALLVGFEALYLFVDFFIFPTLTPTTAALHASAIAVTALVLALTMSRWFERNWRTVCFANLLAIYGLTLGLRLLGDNHQPLFLTLVFTLLGAGALLRWSRRWQIALSAVALATSMIPSMTRASVEPQSVYHWVGVLTAAALGHFILLMRERHRVELLRWMNSLREEIAEHEQAQRRVQQSEQTLRRIFEASLDAITVKRLSDGRYVEVNKEFQVFGYSRDEALGKTAEELGIWADPKQLEAFSQSLKLSGRVRNRECLCRTRDGRIIPSLISAVITELNGEPCVVSFVRDISQLKQTEHELIAAREAALAASEAKTHFLSVMSHEIRTPMNAILGMAELLCETPLNPEQRRYLDTMRNNSASLLNLVNGILDLSKVESGRLVLEHADFDLVELAEDVMETLAVRAHEKGLELALYIPHTLPTALTGDSLRLRQILINLLGNAIKFTEHGEVTLTIEPADPAQGGESPAPPPEAEGAAACADAGPPVKRQLLRFSVRDTGIGIPAERQEAIFSNFIQADSAIGRKYGGSGLGLTIVRRLVELMNGKVTVESRPHEGSIFSFVVALELQPATAARPPSPAGMARLTGKRVLVADDSPASRAILAELLRLAGAATAVAADGPAALAELARARAAGQPYDAVVVDLRMPGPDGAAIAEHLMAASHTPREAMVLMLQVNDLNSQIGRLRERGLQESQRCRYLLKPVRRADFWAALAAVCAGTAPDERPSYNGRQAAGFVRRAASRNAALLINKPLRILLAEDSVDNRLLIEAYLKGTPYHLDLAENGEVAVQKFATGHYDAILMDIQMPVMDGYEAVAEIRRLEHSDHRRPTPIIVLTAAAHDEAIRRSLKMGCDAHVTKPVNRSTLLETIRDAVEPGPQAAASAAQTADNGAGSGTAIGSGQPIVVHIDQDLSDLVPGFLTRKREDGRAILAAVERGDPEAIARLGHKMKGEGGSYGLDAITDLGRDLEQAGQDSDLDAARRLGGNLMNFLERVEIVYRPVED